MKIIKGNEYNIEIESIASDGRGVGHIDRLALFVPFSAPGDYLRVRAVKVSKSYAAAEIVSIINPSPFRIKPPCPVYKECGGCCLMHIDYITQLKAKKSIIENAMRRIGGFSDFSADEMIGAVSSVRYRNKMVFHAGRADGKTVFGFYAPKSHRVIPLRDCAAGAQNNSAILRAMAEYMDETGLSPYDERTFRGSVRSVFTRRSFSSGDTMVVISVNGNRIPKPELLTGRLTAADKSITSIILNVNKSKRFPLLDGRNITLYGSDYIEDEILGVKFKISPHSFFQVNPEMTQRLYMKAVEFLEADKGMNILDIYCGIGTISLIAAKSAKKVTGVEIAESAVADARENAAANNIDNAVFYAGRAEDIVPELIRNGERPDAVILDPPRKGSDSDTIAAIISAAPKRIVYVSCNPATLARDAALFCGGGYEISRCCGVDMFAGSAHVETIVLLGRRDM